MVGRAPVISALMTKKGWVSDQKDWDSTINRACPERASKTRPHDTKRTKNKQNGSVGGSARSGCGMGAVDCRNCHICNMGGKVRNLGLALNAMGNQRRILSSRLTWSDTKFQEIGF